jgi:hypothetical protein
MNEVQLTDKGEKKEARKKKPKTLRPDPNIKASNAADTHGQPEVHTDINRDDTDHKTENSAVKSLPLLTNTRHDENRQGVWVDDLVFRLVAKLVNDLFAHNKLAISKILASAAANQTSSAVYGAVTGIARNAAEEFLTFNPKSLLHGASYVGKKAAHMMDSKVRSAL